MGANVQTVTGNLVEVLSYVRIEMFSGVKCPKMVFITQLGNKHNSETNTTRKQTQLGNKHNSETKMTEDELRNIGFSI
jgi:hypothetical protein